MLSDGDDELHSVDSHETEIDGDTDQETSSDAIHTEITEPTANDDVDGEEGEIAGSRSSTAGVTSGQTLGDGDQVRLERVLCCNIISGDHSATSPLFRHPVFGFDEELMWPPSGWRAWKCMHCIDDLSEPPIPVPTGYDKVRNLFKVFGIFCGWSCGKAFMLETQGLVAAETLLLEMMAREHFGYSGPVIARAPPRHRLSCFGGDLCREEFRRLLRAGQEEVRCTLYPPVLLRPEVYERCSQVEESEGWVVRGTRLNTSTISPALDKTQIVSTLSSDRKPQVSLYSAFAEARGANFPRQVAPPRLNRSSNSLTGSAARTETSTSARNIASSSSTTITVERLSRAASSASRSSASTRTKRAIADPESREIPDILPPPPRSTAPASSEKTEASSRKDSGKQADEDDTAPPIAGTLTAYMRRR
jgi:hypothetical protein